MKVEVWSDYVCPFCYIGKRSLEQALAQFAHRNEVEVIYKSFELNPQAKRDGNPHVYKMLSEKYGMSDEKVKENIQGVTRMAQSVGLTYHMDKTIQTNTFDAHRLAHYARTHHKLEAIVEKLMKAHFTDGLHIGDRESLARLAEEIGFNKSEVLQMLQEDQFANEVRHEEKEARENGVNGVPYFLIDEKYYISGAQSSEVFKRALQQAWEERDVQKH